MTHPSSNQSVIIRPFQTGNEEALASILWAAFDAGELQGSTRSDVDHWRMGIAGDPDRTIVATADDQIAGLVTLPVEHLVVAQKYRRRGIGTRLVEAAEGLSLERGEAPLYLALPRDNSGAKAFYEAIGWQYHHSLWSMRIDNDKPVPAPDFPNAVVRCAYRDELIPQLVDMINTIFLDHPTPLTVTQEQMEFAHTNPAFNPESLYLLADVNHPEQLVGFCRVGFDRSDNDIKGWIPLIGVRREWREHGIGRQLLRWGVNYARQQGASAVYLAVEGDNERARWMYEATGFCHVDEWLRFGRPEHS